MTKNFKDYAIAALCALLVICTALASPPEMAAAGSGPASCIEYENQHPGTGDGEKDLLLGGSLVSIYCSGMDSGTPKEYLTLQAVDTESNFSSYAKNNGTPGPGVTTWFSKVRIDPASLEIISDDFTFATPPDPDHYIDHGGRQYQIPYGTARSCDFSRLVMGSANVNLTGTPFTVDRDAENPFVLEGLTPQGGSFYEASGQIVRLTGNGFCGSIGPITGKVPLKLLGQEAFAEKVSSPSPNGSYGAGAQFSILVKYNKPVFLDGSGAAPRLLLNTGDYAEYESGSGTNVLEFSYTAGSVGTPRLNYPSIGALDLQSMDLKDGDGGQVKSTLPRTGSAYSLGGSNSIIILTETRSIWDSTPSSPAFGEEVALRVQVSADASGTPAGTVTFRENTETLGSVNLSNGVAVLRTTALSTGLHTIDAEYEGSDLHVSSSPAPLSLEIRKAVPSVDFTFARNSSEWKEPVTFTAEVAAPYGGTPTGEVVFLDNTTELSRVTLINGKAEFTSSSLSSGGHEIYALYTGDDNFGEQQSAKKNVEVGPDEFTVSFESNGGSPVADQVVSFDGNAVQPADPERNGYIFAGWYEDASLDVLFDFENTKLRQDQTLYAKWEADTTALSAAITVAQARLDSTQEGDEPGQFPAAARAELAAAIGAAQGVAADKQATSAAVAAAADALSAALGAYNAAEVPEADKAALNAAITEAQARLDSTQEGDEPGQFPAAARAELAAAIGAAQSIAADKQAAAAAVAAAADALSAALGAYNSAEVPEADKTALSAAITVAQARLDSTQEGDEPGQFPAAARAELAAAIGAAQGVAADKQAAAAAVAAAADALSAALGAYNAAEVPEPDAPVWEPGELAVSEVTKSSLRLDWPSATARAGVEGYRIYVNNAAEPTAVTATYSVYSYTFRGLEPGMSYTFTVKAYNAAGEGTGLVKQALTKADTAELRALIAEAEARLEATQEGTAAGQFPAGARSELQSRISSALNIAAGEGLLQQAVTEELYILKNALAAYNAAEIPAPPPANEYYISGDAGLRAIAIRIGGQNVQPVPGFDSGIQHYTLETGAAEIQISAQSSHEFAVITLLQDGEVRNLGNSISLHEGDNEIELKVRAQDGGVRSYYLKIHRTKTETPGFEAGEQPDGQPEPPEVTLLDIAGHWAESSIREALAAKLVSGYPEGTFRPDAAVTRAEFVVILVHALQPAGQGTGLRFKDAAGIPGWAQSEIAQAAELGLVSGYEDGSFHPGNSITRAEMALILARVLKIGTESRDGTGFADDADIPEWAKGASEALRLQGVMTGRDNNRMDSRSEATRAEAVVLVLRLLLAMDK
ncbi:Ig-like domain repeat protein [Paenibacillus sp. S150]|uniref:Ig-like domain repeat protein n=1 Tax=Paenibacillus sp. S150 TaxID=2749826 RepID=UPI001C56F67D|nr:Ig-like domain repeat protein [Paenibacillus sp. S150]MBW4085426.1 Ig-like domain repeat protein [Paenibacillus sp. S150]